MEKGIPQQYLIECYWKHISLKSITTVGSDGTTVITGANSGCIRILQELLGKPLQWNISLLHCNEFPLRNVFTELVVATKSECGFSGNLG